MSYGGASTAVVEAMDMAWEVRCREEDMRQRSIDNIRRQIDDCRRAMDEKCQLLTVVSNLSALIAGFAMVVMIEISYPDKIHTAQLVLFGTTGAVAISAMLVSMLHCTMMLIAVLKFNSTQQDPVRMFDKFWNSRCEDDWRSAYRTFTRGIYCFMLLLAQLGWVIFGKYHDVTFYTSSIIITIVAVVTLIWFVVHIGVKWYAFNITAVKNDATSSPASTVAMQRV